MARSLTTGEKLGVALAAGSDVVTYLNQFVQRIPLNFLGQKSFYDNPRDGLNIALFVTGFLLSFPFLKTAYDAYGEIRTPAGLPIKCVGAFYKIVTKIFSVLSTFLDLMRLSNASTSAVWAGAGMLTAVNAFPVAMGETIFLLGHEENVEPYLKKMTCGYAKPLCHATNFFYSFASACITYVSLNGLFFHLNWSDAAWSQDRKYAVANAANITMNFFMMLGFMLYNGKRLQVPLLESAPNFSKAVGFFAGTFRAIVNASSFLAFLTSMLQFMFELNTNEDVFKAFFILSTVLLSLATLKPNIDRFYNRTTGMAEVMVIPVGTDEERAFLLPMVADRSRPAPGRHSGGYTGTT